MHASSNARRPFGILGPIPSSAQTTRHAIGPGAAPTACRSPRPTWFDGSSLCRTSCPAARSQSLSQQGKTYAQECPAVCFDLQARRRAYGDRASDDLRIQPLCRVPRVGRAVMPVRARDRGLAGPQRRAERTRPAGTRAAALNDVRCYGRDATGMPGRTCP